MVVTDIMDKKKGVSCYHPIAGFDFRKMLLELAAWNAQKNDLFPFVPLHKAYQIIRYRILLVAFVTAIAYIRNDFGFVRNMRLIAGLTLLVYSRWVAADPVEEFTIRGPTELHSIALDTFIKEREKDPANKELGHDTPVMRRARAHAEKRFAATPESSLRMQVIDKSFHR